MLEDWFGMMEIVMPLEAWHRLPRNAGYKYEYVKGKAQITPEPKCCDVVLELESFRAAELEEWERWEVRRLREEDWAELPEVMAAAFSGVAPFATLPEEEMRGAMADGLKHTRAGRDGELIPSACVALMGPWGNRDELQMMGAALVTLRAGETAVGEMTPLLAWIMVVPMVKRRGGGSVLLAAVVEELRRLGHKKLESVVCTGNHGSMTWHWHRGFVMGMTIRERVRERMGRRTKV
ncbi:MAG TPA: hypothetical protein VGN88_02055 [Phycisphaerae bacterium]